EGAMHQVGNAHQAEDQREAGRQQEQQAAQRNAVHRQCQPKAHGVGLTPAPVPVIPEADAPAEAIRDPAVNAFAGGKVPDSLGFASASGMTGAASPSSRGSWRGDSRARRPGWPGSPSPDKSRTG